MKKMISANFRKLRATELYESVEVQQTFPGLRETLVILILLKKYYSYPIYFPKNITRILFIFLKI